MTLTNKQLIAIAVTIAVIVVSVWYYRILKCTQIQINDLIPDSNLIILSKPSDALMSMAFINYNVNILNIIIKAYQPCITVSQIIEIEHKVRQLTNLPVDQENDKQTADKIVLMSNGDKLNDLTDKLTKLNIFLTSYQTTLGSITDLSEKNNIGIYIKNCNIVIDNVNRFIKFYS